jgi:ABC-2 type transport system ATP-binding protein
MPDRVAAPPILVRDLHKQYRETHAVRGVTFQVEAGQVLGLIGPNGAGKTTTMRCACGVIPPTSGQLRIAGHDVVADAIAAKRELAYVPDDPHLFEALTVWEHLRFTAAAYRVTLPEWQTHGEDLLRQFELAEKKNTIAQELSRGMRQKTAICCAYLHRPRALWLDEPLTGLDPRGIRTMKDSIRRLAAEGAAAVVSSHLLSLVEDLCTHVLILRRGERVFFGSMDEARAAMRAAGDTSLEELFFRLTETPAPAAADGQGATAEREAAER